MTTMNVGEAKTNLSRLLDAALKGEEVVIARNGTPLVRLVPVGGPAPRVLGRLPLDIPDEMFDPLTGDDLGGWT